MSPNFSTIFDLLINALRDIKTKMLTKMVANITKGQFWSSTISKFNVTRSTI